ncbi:YlbL family protein [Paeniglutamicibacter gangotriensis]|uniref:endopeptidase La n=1 Tax=Paeniglutamicibacter gangotriensis Lz1y TaxID=1276920 RepID=M7NME5_9MICC|nr:S16 family serine protease [Paeniglutamicibacter gangotriensis]EMQ99698.1 degradative enzyme [Paeniglutamicibacter gangotriensis Lz1y]
MPAAPEGPAEAPADGIHHYLSMSAEPVHGQARPPGGTVSDKDAGTATLRANRAIAGWLAMVLIVAATVLPTHFVVQSAGPALNTIGEVEGTKLLAIDGKKTYPVTGALDMTTIYSPGGGQQRLPFFNVLWGWINPDQDVIPEEIVVPRGITSTEKSEANTLSMDDSQQLSTAAALTELDIDYSSHLGVAGFATELNAGVLKTGDRLESINGKKITDLEMLKKQLAAAGEAPSKLEILREDKKQSVSVSTDAGPEGQRQLGILLSGSFDFPLEVKFGLENVGGPSAGMMFALAIVDLLTEGSMTGGEHFAGTGTITADGAVGPIGGIAQKLVGAKDEGAKYFLAPADNCPDVVGRIPAGLEVLKVSTLAEARSVVEGIGAGADPASFPGCS